ncbi:large-conductance mechanosensitive channel protein MscL [Bacteroidetes/Chlorobi group bacterium Naka2016]|jgi:large conductance mechanosensitive channel|nr:MAG: large-conductance mechanosensitive channel protein MscL [Bacteroidetes/Chlorobi group bacterium Naka2016]
MGKLFEEFKSFALRGNVLDMAVGIILGSAFGKIVSSLVNDIIMPPIGLLLGGINFTDIKIFLKEATANQVAVTINIGNFIQIIVDFLIIAFSIFLIVELFNSLKKKKEEKVIEQPQVSKTEILLEEIRDILKSNK